MVKMCHPSKENTGRYVIRIGDEIPGNEAVYEAEHGVLNRAYCIKMSTMANGMARGVDSMWLIGAHDPRKYRSA